MKRILLSIVRGDRAAVGFIAIAPVLVSAVALAFAPLACAQFTSDPPAVSDTGDAAPPAVADPPADVPIDGAAPADAADSSAAPAAASASDSTSDDSITEHSGWVRSGDEETGNDAPPDQVLEVPQAVNPADAQSGGGSGQTAGNGDSSSPDQSSPDQVGSVGDYQDEDAFGGGGYINSGALNPYGPGAGRAHAGSLNFGSGYVPTNPYGPIIGRPGGNGMNTAIGSSSPMLPGPANLSPMPGRW
jgi:hypothetical protein